MIPASTLARAVLLAATLCATQAFAEEVPVGIDQQTGIAVTIYNSDLALIRDERKVDLKSGLNELAFIDVSAGIRPEAALLTAPGVIRAYKSDSRGEAVYVGDDAIDHTPKNEEVDLTLGQAVDVTAHIKRIDFKIIVSNRVYEVAYEVELNNAKQEAITVDFREETLFAWEITEENLEHRKLDSTTASWLVDVPAEGSAKLRYRVRVEI